MSSVPSPVGREVKHVWLAGEHPSNPIAVAVFPTKHPFFLPPIVPVFKVEVCSSPIDDTRFLKIRIEVMPKGQHLGVMLLPQLLLLGCGIHSSSDHGIPNEFILRRTCWAFR